MSNPYMVKQVLTFSDGSEIVTNYTENPNKEEIEAIVAEAVAGDHKISNDAPVEDVVIVSEGKEDVAEIVSPEPEEIEETIEKKKKK